MLNHQIRQSNLAPNSYKDIPAVQEWLEQFETPGRYIAEDVLTKLRFISFEEFESKLQEGLIEIINSIRKSGENKTTIAILPTSRNPVNKHNKGKKIKLANDSAGRIGHLLTNFERTQAHIEVSPRDKSLVDQGVRNIIFVDDIIASGSRFIKYWNDSVSQTIKNLILQGNCQIWLFSYAVHSTGRKNILNELKFIKSNNIKSFIEFNDDENSLNNLVIKTVLKKYASRTKKEFLAFGYSDILSPFIFQHGCPNNCPAIFWASGKPFYKDKVCDNSDRWNALFHNRGIKEELYPLFNLDLTIVRAANLLWDNMNYNLALNFLDSMDAPIKDHKFQQTYMRTLAILGLLKRNISEERIQAQLLLSESELSKEIITLQQANLLSHNQVTKFGIDFLNRAKKRISRKTFENYYKSYYPSVFMGLQREV